MYKISYTGDGTISEYIFAFPFFQESDVRVSIDGRILNYTEYDVNPNAAFDGGTVVFAAAPADGLRIDIFRQVTLGRVVDYQPTEKIDPENLNTDFNLLMAAFKDLNAIDIDLIEWKHTHDNLIGFIKYATELIEDKLSGGGVLGLFKNLLTVLDGALPRLINDYGSVTIPAPNENRDDYGIL